MPKQIVPAFHHWLISFLFFFIASMSEFLVSNIMHTFIYYFHVGTSFCHGLSVKVYYSIGIHISEFIIYYIKYGLCWTSQSPDYNCPFNLLRIPHNTNPWSLSLSLPHPSPPSDVQGDHRSKSMLEVGAFGELISLIVK